MKTEALIRRREMRVVVWWNGDKDLARDLEVVKDHERYLYLGYEINPAWVHVEPDIPEGTLCYGWNGHNRPAYPWIGTFKRSWYGSTSIAVSDGGKASFYHIVDHIEPIQIATMIKWEKIRKGLDLLELESGRRALEEAGRYRVGQFYDAIDDHIIAIHKRPEHE